MNIIANIILTTGVILFILTIGLLEGDTAPMHMIAGFLAVAFAAIGAGAMIKSAVNNRPLTDLEKQRIVNSMKR